MSTPLLITASASSLAKVMWLLCDSAVGGDPFCGEMAEIGFWNRALTPAEGMQLWGNDVAPSILADVYPAAANVASGSGVYGPNGSGYTPSYPTTATSQAAQLATDEAAVAAQAANILNTATILGVTGTYTPSLGSVPSLSSILCTEYYRSDDFAVLFNLPASTARLMAGGKSSKLLLRVQEFIAGGYGVFNPASMTAASVAAFQKQTCSYVLNGILQPSQTYSAEQIGDLFHVTTAAVANSNLGPPPYTGAAIVSAAQGYPGNSGILNFANVTPATITNFNAAPGP